MGTNFLRASHKRVFHQRSPTASPTDTLPHCHFRRYKQSQGMISQQRRMRFIRWLMFCALRLLQRIRSRTLVSTHTLRTSAAMAAHPFNGTAILLIVTHFCLSTPVITFPKPVFEASIPETTCRIPCCRRLSCRNQFFFVPVRQCRPSGLLLDYVLCRHGSRSCRC